jgi:two-component system, LytTR family, sensor kinase
MLKRLWIRWLLAVLGWTAVAVFFASQTYLSYKYSGGQAHLWLVLKMNLIEWYVWGLLAPGIVWLARRFPLEREHWARSLAIHSVAGVGVSLLKWTLNNLLRRYLLGFPKGMYLIYVFHQNFVTYWIVVAATQGYLYYSRYREGELRTAQLSAQLAQAQLQALRMQLHPHFLFNTLNAISTLVHKDPEIADRMIARLSDLLRLTLENIGVQEVRLAQELQFLERYLEIERMRFPDRLQVRMHIAPETLDARAPYLILQPIVENAIRHGIAPRSTLGTVEIRADCKNDRLILEVRDDGPGISPENIPKDGVGISSTRARLERLYGAAHKFELRNAAEGGLVVTLAMPFRLTTEDSGAQSGGGGPS